MKLYKGMVPRIILFVCFMMIAPIFSEPILLTRFTVDRDVFKGYDGCYFLTTSTSIKYSCEEDVAMYAVHRETRCGGEPILKKKYDGNGVTKCIDSSNIKLQVKNYEDDACWESNFSMLYLVGENTCARETDASSMFNIEGQAVTIKTYGTTNCTGTVVNTETYTLDKCTKRTPGTEELFPMKSRTATTTSGASILVSTTWLSSLLILLFL